MDQAINRLRRFHRAVTSQAGVLDHSFLGRGRPLGPARLLNAIGGGRHDLGEIRRYLGLDSGLMSRLLRGLEQEGLIALREDQGDGRRKSIWLTPEGQAEYEAYEKLSNEQALGILSKSANQEKLLQAMDLIANTLNQDHVSFDLVDPLAPLAVGAMQAYYAELSQRLSQGFDVKLSADPEATAMLAPKGAFLLAISDGQVIGCGGLKGTDKGFAEIKRVWIAPSARGLGLSRRMMAALEDQARTLGIKTLRLDSNSALHEAISLYRKTGWTEIERFNDDPYPDHFFEKIL